MSSHQFVMLFPLDLIGHGDKFVMCRVWKNSSSAGRLEPHECEECFNVFLHSTIELRGPKLDFSWVTGIFSLLPPRRGKRVIFFSRSNGNGKRITRVFSFVISD